MLLEMEKLERKHLLKHYQGGFAMVMSEGLAVTGQIEQVDMEDGSVLIHAEERSQWVDGEKVTPSLKTWEHLKNADDISTIIENIIYENRRLCLADVVRIHNDSTVVRIQCKIDGRLFAICIDKHWNFLTPEGGIQNIGSIIFLLCELGYDVTGQFHK